MRQPRLLDLYCCAGGAGYGYKLAGFHVTGVDISQQKRYAGDVFVQADALEYCAAHYREFDCIAASPPCQAHTALRTMPNHKEHIDMIPDTRAMLIATGLPYIIENVPGAPLLNPVMLCGTMFGLRTADGTAELRRHRMFECSFPVPLVPECQHARNYRYTICVVGSDGAARGNQHRPSRLTSGVYGSDGISGFERKRRRERATIPVDDGGDQGWDKRRPHTVGVYGGSGGGSTRNKYRQFGVQQRKEAMGIDWMVNDELTQAIPPAYTHFLGLQLLQWLGGN